MRACWLRLTSTTAGASQRRHSAPINGEENSLYSHVRVVGMTALLVSRCWPRPPARCRLLDDDQSRRRREHLHGGSFHTSTTDSEPSTPEAATDQAAFGQAYTWADGLQATVSAADPLDPGRENTPPILRSPARSVAVLGGSSTTVSSDSWCGWLTPQRRLLLD